VRRHRHAGFRGTDSRLLLSEDFTGGCTIETNSFQRALPQFQESGITVYGVSMDDVEIHAEFADAEGIVFDLLADPDDDVVSALGLDTIDGRTPRRTFVLADGEVTAVYDSELADPEGHAQEVLRDVRNEHVQGG